MALVCDIKSDPPKTDEVNEDLEDGEIEDDDDEDNTEIPPDTKPESTVIAQLPQPPPTNIKIPPPPPQVDTHLYENKFNPNEKYLLDKSNREKRKHDEKKKPHLTEAEKHVMHLHKLERLEREKREKYRREQGTETLVEDDFASNIEKAIASVLKRDKQVNDDVKEEDKRSNRKRKKKDKEKRKNKQRKLDSPKSEEIDENEMLNIRGGSPDKNMPNREQSQSPYDSYDSDSSDRSREDKRDKKKETHKRGFKAKNRDRARDNRKFNQDRNNRERRTEVSLKDSQICMFYMQGKCNKGEDCIYSHEVLPPMKFELCKFYQMDCCAKGDKCLYMHSDFPCKFYHTGLPCPAGENCKFAHGKALSEACKQILFKHLETAPREILGGYPRMSREEFFKLLTQTQKTLESKLGQEKKGSSSEVMGKSGTIPSLFDISVPMPMELLHNKDDKAKSDKPARSRPSRWQDADPADISKALQEQQQLQLGLNFKGLYSERDQDLRINSNGDVDMRTLALPQLQLPQQQSNLEQSEKVQKLPQCDVDIRTSNFIRNFDTDIRPRDLETSKLDIDSRNLNNLLPNGDVDIRQAFSSIYDDRNLDESNDKDEPTLQIVLDAEKTTDEEDRLKSDIELPSHLPKMQRELFMRIQAQQKDNLLENQRDVSDTEDNDVNWYSDDDDDRLTIKVDAEEVKDKKEDTEEDEQEKMCSSPIAIKPVEVIEKLGDLSKIDISEEVTKLLTSISQSSLEQKVPKDPRQVAQSVSDVQKSVSTVNDPRKARLSTSGEKKKPEKMSIYEQGSISVAEANKDVDLRSEKDLDLRGAVFGDTDLRSVAGRPDIDLRQLALPFKAIQNYTPASEIDASINSHPPISWNVKIVEIPRPDYTGLKLNIQDAHTTGDPRLRKIFRLSTEEKESPASPKMESPKTARVDPRRRKMEESKVEGTQQMTYMQQLSMLQSSAFYQSLTSNQKLLLNQELASRADQTGNQDPVLSGILSSLGLITTPGIVSGNVSAMSILANVSNLAAPLLAQNAGMLAQNQNLLVQNPNMMNQMTQAMVQPGLLGAAPGIPNLPPDFQINFDPRNGGLLGNAPGFNNGLQPDGSNFNFGEDYYHQDSGNSFGNRRPRRGRNNFGRGNNPRKFRNMNNKNNRGRSSPP